jgi:hypothetical protein
VGPVSDGFTVVVRSITIASTIKGGTDGSAVCWAIPPDPEDEQYQIPIFIASDSGSDYYSESWNGRQAAGPGASLFLKCNADTACWFIGTGYLLEGVASFPS